MGKSFMKHETSEKLYTESAHILTTLLVTTPLSLVGAACQTLIIYAMSGLAYKFLPIVFGWTLLLFCFFDAIFQCVAAAAPDSQQAQTLATPFLVIFMLFNGSIVSRATAPVYLRWIFALQSIVVPMAQDAPNGQIYIDMMGYRSGESFKGIVVILCMTVVLRILQIAALRFLNKLQK